MHCATLLGLTSSTQGERIVEFLLHILDTDESEKVQALLCVGLSKLMLSGMVADERVCVFVCCDQILQALCLLCTRSSKVLFLYTSLRRLSTIKNYDSAYRISSLCTAIPLRRTNGECKRSALTLPSLPSTLKPILSRSSFHFMTNCQRSTKSGMATRT